MLAHIVPAIVVLFAVLAFVVGMLRTSEVVPLHIPGDIMSQIGAGVLIEAKMNAAVDARIADIGSDLVKPGVVEGQPWHARVRHRDDMPALTVRAP